ncbi:MAG: F0F1 ATP synthase subunit C [Holosporales bacterium]|nr:F0F1 ATP synthase subunit C [Holosporales bacterium]
MSIVSKGMDVDSMKMIGAGLATFALTGVGLGLGKIFSAVSEAIGRNPSARDSLFPIALIGGAMTESIALFAFIVAMLILFK